jgi:hypothetical protein
MPMRWGEPENDIRSGTLLRAAKAAASMTAMVKSGNTHNEKMLSGFPSKADAARRRSLILRILERLNPRSLLNNQPAVAS